MERYRSILSQVVRMMWKDRTMREAVDKMERLRDHLKPQYPHAPDIQDRIDRVAGRAIALMQRYIRRFEQP